VESAESTWLAGSGTTCGTSVTLSRPFAYESNFRAVGSVYLAVSGLRA
jgi:hypothetical protein